jgi:hypothetical protein
MIKTNKSYLYKAFGLTILSEILLPELPKLCKENVPVDILIEVADLSKLWFELSVPNKKTVYRENLFMFQFSDIATFLVEGGKRIIVQPLEGSDKEQIRLYILGTCMGAILMQRKILPLHGSAVSINGKAYAFVGDSGAGKSTLASAFLNKGCYLLSDDILAISFREGSNIPLITPSYPHQKLWQESLDGLGLETKNYRPIFQRETKYSVPVSEKYFTSPLPLAGVFELKKTDNNDIEVYCVNSLERLDLLSRNTYRNFLIPRFDLMEWHFNTLVSFVNRIDIYQLLRPSIGFTVNDIVTNIFEILKREEKHYV